MENANLSKKTKIRIKIHIFVRYCPWPLKRGLYPSLAGMAVGGKGLKKRKTGADEVYFRYGQCPYGYIGCPSG